MESNSPNNIGQNINVLPAGINKNKKILPIPTLTPSNYTNKSYFPGRRSVPKNLYSKEYFNDVVNPISIDNITTQVEKSRNRTKKIKKNVIPLISPEELIEPENRPIAPIDETPIVINGVEIAPTEITSVLDDIVIPEKLETNYIEVPPMREINLDNFRNLKNAIPKNVTTKPEPINPIPQNIVIPKNNFSDINPTFTESLNNSSAIRADFASVAANIPMKIDTNIPDYSSMSIHEQTYYRTEFHNKFCALRRNLRHYTVPEIDPNMSLECIHMMYNSYLRRVHITYDVDQYRNFLVIGWLGIELVSKLMLNLSLEGFTKYQIRNYNRYENLLIELGESTYQDGSVMGTGITAGWSPIFKIVFSTLVSVASFIMIKLIAKLCGERIATAIVDALGNTLVGVGNNIIGADGNNGIPVAGNVFETPAVNNPAPQNDLSNSLATLGSVLINNISQDNPIIGNMVRGFFGGSTATAEPLPQPETFNTIPTTQSRTSSPNGVKSTATTPRAIDIGARTPVYRPQYYDE